MSRKNHKRKGRRRKKPVRQKRSPAFLVLILLLGAVLGALASSGAPRVSASLLPVTEFLRDIRITAPDWPSLETRLRTPELSLDTVEFMGLRTLEARDLWKLCGVKHSEPLVDISPGRVCERLLEQPRVKGCTASRVPPSRLLIEIEERVAVARVEGNALALDREGEQFPLHEADPATLPILRGDIPSALPLIEAARDLDEPLEMVIAESKRAIWFIPPGESLRVRIGDNPEEGLKTWRRLSQSGLLEGSEIEPLRELDLRFEGNAVVRSFDKP